MQAMAPESFDRHQLGIWGRRGSRYWNALKTTRFPRLDTLQLQAACFIPR